MPNNRQLALAFWMLVLFGCLLRSRDTRRSLARLLRTLWSPIFVGIMCLVCAWLFAALFVGYRSGLWNVTLISDTILWLLSSGLVLVFAFDRVGKQTHFFRRTIGSALGASAVIEIVSELYVMRLPIELVLVPVVTVFACVPVLPADTNETERAQRFAAGCLSVAGLAVLLFVAAQIFVDRHSLEVGRIVQQVALPLWLTLWFSPFVYALSLYSGYEGVFKRLQLGGGQSRVQRFLRTAVLLFFVGLRVRRLDAFSFEWVLRLRKAERARDVVRVLRDFSQRQREIGLAEEIVTADLEQYSGSDCVNEHGCRRDRRGFDITCKALRKVALEMMVTFDGETFREDLFALETDELEAMGFPSDVQPIVLVRRSDGQAWIAWSRTISGWVFAVGGTPDVTMEYEYDGPEPPAGFPGDDDGWDSDPEVHIHSRNWNA